MSGIQYMTFLHYSTRIRNIKHYGVFFDVAKIPNDISKIQPTNLNFLRQRCLNFKMTEMTTALGKTRETAINLIVL